MTQRQIVQAMARTIIERRVNQQDYGAIWVLAAEMKLDVMITPPLLDASYRPLTSEDYTAYIEGGPAYIK